MPLILTEDPQFYGVEVSFSYILITDFFCSNNRIAIFSETEKNPISQQTRKGRYIYDVHMEGGCHDFEDSFVFESIDLRDLLFIFPGKEGGHKLIIFCGRHKCMTPKWFKITTNSIITVSSLLISITPDTFRLHREQPTAPLLTLTPNPMMIKSKLHLLLLVGT